MKISNIAHGGNVKCQAIVPKYVLREFDPMGHLNLYPSTFILSV